MSIQVFRRLHEGPGLLVLPNAWDAGSARLIESVGAKAIATIFRDFCLAGRSTRKHWKCCCAHKRLKQSGLALAGHHFENIPRRPSGAR